LIGHAIRQEYGIERLRHTIYPLGGKLIRLKRDLQIEQYLSKFLLEDDERSALELMNEWTTMAQFIDTQYLDVMPSLILLNLLSAADLLEIAELGDQSISAPVSAKPAEKSQSQTKSGTATHHVPIMGEREEIKTSVVTPAKMINSEDPNRERRRATVTVFVKEDRIETISEVSKVGMNQKLGDIYLGSQQGDIDKTDSHLIPPDPTILEVPVIGNHKPDNFAVVGGTSDDTKEGIASILMSHDKSEVMTFIAEDYVVGDTFDDINAMDPDLVSPKSEIANLDFIIADDENIEAQAFDNKSNANQWSQPAPVRQRTSAESGSAPSSAMFAQRRGLNEIAPDVISSPVIPRKTPPSNPAIANSSREADANKSMPNSPTAIPVSRDVMRTPTASTSPHSTPMKQRPPAVAGGGSAAVAGGGRPTAAAAGGGSTAVAGGGRPTSAVAGGGSAAVAGGGRPASAVAGGGSAAVAGGGRSIANTGTAKSADKVLNDEEAKQKEAILSKYNQIKGGVNYYELLEVSRNATADKIRSSYHKLSRIFHPDLASGTNLMALQDTLSEIFSFLNEAYTTLMSADKRKEYDEMLEDPEAAVAKERVSQAAQAEVFYAKGVVFLKMRDFVAAEEQLGWACQILRDEGDYQASLAWAIYNNPQNDKANSIAKALHHLDLAKQFTAEPEKLYYYLGVIQQKQGNLEEALISFNALLKHNPRHTEATRAVRDIKALMRRDRETKVEEEPKKKGWSLFKK
jgi:curved DNA-binding protein CbpA